MVEKAADDLTLLQGAGHDLGDVFGFDLEVGDLLGPDGDDGASLAKAVAAGPEYVDLVGQTGLVQLVHEREVHLLAARGVTAGAGADGDAGPARILGGKQLVPVGLEVGS